GAAQDGGALLPVAPREVGEQLLEPASRDRICTRKVGPAEDRGSVGCEEHSDRIAPETREELHRGAITLRHVGTLVTVDAHGDKQRIDHGAQPGVAVHLAVHHPAPATVVRSHIKKDGPVEARREGERIAPPRLPAHRLAGGPGQIGRGRLRHAVCERPVLRDAAGQREQRQWERERRQSSHGSAWKIPCPSRRRSHEGHPDVVETRTALARPCSLRSLALTCGRPRDYPSTMDPPRITPKANGPLIVEGPVKIVTP